MKRETSNIEHHTSPTTHHPSRTTLLATLLLLGIVALLIGCNPPQPPPVPRPNVVIAIEGTAQLKRSGWQVYSPMGFGTLLKYDDLLEVDGSVQILCGDLTVRTLATGRDSCPCPAWEGAFEVDGAAYRNIPHSVPYIQYPRNTLVLETQPLLRWHDTNAASYTVAVIQGGQSIWQQTGVTDTALIYPVDAPPLQPGVDYLLRVWDEDSGVSSNEDPARGIGFRLITPEQRATLEAHCAPVTGLTDLDAAVRDYALALCYATWEPKDGERRPWGTAWQLLESVTQTHDAPTVHLRRGDLLLAMRLSDEAIAAYRSALERAEALGDLESQAVAHEHLYELTDDVVHRDAAAKIYDRLGK